MTPRCGIRVQGKVPCHQDTPTHLTVMRSSARLACARRSLRLHPQDGGRDLFLIFVLEHEAIYIYSSVCVCVCGWKTNEWFSAAGVM